MSWNRMGERPAAPHKKSRGKAFWFVLCTVFLLSAICILVSFQLRKGVIDEPKALSSSSGLIKEYNDSHTDLVQPTLSSNQTTTIAQPINKPYEKKPGQMQLPDGQILTFPIPKEGSVRKVIAYGHIYECDHLGNFKDVTPRQFFNTAFEANFFALANEDHIAIPAFLLGLDESDVRAMLTKKREPIGDETEEELKQLDNYDQMRKAALELMDAGHSFDDLVTEFATFERKQRIAKATCLREVVTLYKNGKIDEARDAAEAANVLMEKNGYKPIQFPAYIQKHFDSLPAEN